MKKIIVKESDKLNFNQVQELSVQEMAEIDGGGFPWRRVAFLSAISPLVGVTYTAGYLVGRHDARNNGC
jgi:lactobin A/cerein 7B family class IIb bacteriocin